MFKDRKEAGTLLGELAVQRCKHVHRFEGDHLVVLAILGGGIPVGSQVAKALGCPLDIIAAKKIGAPGMSECAIGATSSQGAFVIDRLSVEEIGIPELHIVNELQRLQNDAKAAEECWRERAERNHVDLDGKTCIIVDDGVATGLTAIAAIRAAKRLGAERVIFAAPIISAHSVQSLERECDLVIAVEFPKVLLSISAYYVDFTTVQTEEAIDLLKSANSVNNKVA